MMAETYGKKLLGRTVSFDPLQDICLTGLSEFGQTRVRGKIVGVNIRGQWFSVQHGNLRYTFHYSDIGKKVSLCK